MKRYVEASPKARQWFFLIAIVLGGLVLFMYVFDTYFPPVGSVLEQLAQMDARATYKLIAFIPIYLVFSVVAFVLAARSVRTRQWPPAGIAVPFRTQIREIRKPF